MKNLEPEMNYFNFRDWSHFGVDTRAGRQYSGVSGRMAGQAHAGERTMNITRTQDAATLAAGEAIWSHTLENEGGTFDPVTGALVDVAQGYVVALGQGTYRIADDEDHDVAVNLIAQYIQQQPISGPDLTRPNIGTWTHEGVVYVDAVEVVDDLFVALGLAADRGELAIWDVAAGAEIFV